VANDTRAGGQAVFQLRVQLQEVHPVVWRRILVPGSVRLSKLAGILCTCVGWQNSHLHQFRTANALYGMHVEEWDDDEIDEKTVSVLQVFRDERRFIFDYDFGDNWHHEVIIENLTWSHHALKFAVCIDGQNACPPEDVGGVGGYGNFLRAITDAEHDEHDDYLEWAGGSFDPGAFDLGSVNAELQRIR
jgi:hypothetical protein